MTRMPTHGFRISLIVLSFLCLALAYLFPLRLAPWNTFNKDVIFLFGSVLLIVSCAKYVAIKKNEIYVAALIIFLQSVASVNSYVGNNTLIDIDLQRYIYVIFGFVLYWSAREAKLNGALQIMGWSIVTASLCLSIISLLIWHGIIAFDASMYGFIASDAVAGRSHSALGQSNNFGTFSVLSLWVAVWLMQSAPKSRFTTLVFAIFVFIVTQGLVISQSRTATLSLLLSTFAALFINHRYSVQRVNIRYLLTPLIIFVIASLAYRLLFDLDARASSVDGYVVGDSQRLRMWRMALEAFSVKPLLGWGVGAIPGIALSYAPKYGAFDYSILTHFHNSFLDLLVEYGLMSLLLILSIFYFVWNALKNSINTESDYLLFTALLPIFIHSMLEFPLNYGFFFWLTAFMLGSLSAVSIQSEIFMTRKVSARWLALLLLPAAYFWWSSYMEVERIYTSIRQGVVYHSHDLRTDVSPTAKFLYAGLLDRAYWIDREVHPKSTLTAQEYQSLTDVASAYPTYLLMWKAATASAASGKVDTAEWWAKRICLMYDAESCDSAGQLWNSVDDPSWPKYDFSVWKIRK